MDTQKAELRLIDLGLSVAARMVVDDILQEIGGHRQQIDSVNACLKLLEHADPPLSLIIDIDAVPGDDDLLHRVYNRNPHCKVLILSTRTFHPELKECMRRNVFAIVNKSNIHHDLRICIQALLESSLIPRGE